jgi:hypothetical protein
MLIISVTNGDFGTMERDGERIYVTGTAPSLGRVRVWMGPESYQSLLDAVRQDGVVWCEVPGNRSPRRRNRRKRWHRRHRGRLLARPLRARLPPGPVPGRSGGRARLLDGPVDEPGSLTGTVILVDVGDGNDERLYVIPEPWARSELRSYATLQFARSYRDVLADDDAVQTVLEGLERYLEDPDEDLEEDPDARELFERRVAEDAPFSAMEFFGDEGWRQWCPGGAESTTQFLEGKAPALWSRFRQPGGGWGIDYEPVDYLAPADEQQIIAGLRALGCEIVRCRGLDRQYWGPAPDLVARIDAGEWPPRPGQPEPPESGR